MSSLTRVKAVAFVEWDKLGLALVAAAGPVLQDSPPLVGRAGGSEVRLRSVVRDRVRECGGRSDVRSWEVRASFGAVRLVGSCRVGGRVRGSCARALGGHTPLQVSLNGKPGGHDQSVRCDLLMRVLDGGPRESDESACLDLGRILDVFGVSPGHCPGREVGQRGDVESGIV